MPSFWSVAQTESQREHTAAKFLKQAGFQIYLPKIQIGLKGRERIAPLFPGYLFVEVVDRWYEIRWTVGVLRLLMVDGAPARVAERVMATIRRQEGRDGLVKLPKPRGLVAGDQVLLLRGSFEGKIGIYQGQSGAERSKVLLNLLGGQVPVWLPSIDLKQVAAPCRV